MCTASSTEKAEFAMEARRGGKGEEDLLSMLGEGGRREGRSREIQYQLWPDS